MFLLYLYRRINKYITEKVIYPGKGPTNILKGNKIKSFAFLATRKKIATEITFTIYFFHNLIFFPLVKLIQKSIFLEHINICATGFHVILCSLISKLD